MSRVGVLALQGGFDEHVRALCELSAEVVEVRRVAELDGLAGLVIPGGESTTLLNLMRDEPWFERIAGLRRRGAALFGTCAGAILLASEVTSPAQPSLGLLDITVQRNGYGRQIDSFEACITLEGSDALRFGDPTLPAVFIRAPRITRVGPGVEVLARYQGEPVLVRDRCMMAASFHPELTKDRRFHRLFLAEAERASASTTGKPEPSARELAAVSGDQRRTRC